MKRNLDLIRTILREIEKKPDGSTYFKVNPPEGVEMSAFMAHLELLIDAGFIKGKVGEYALRSYEINRLTWQGHEFLDATRDDTLWSKAALNNKLPNCLDKLNSLAMVWACRFNKWCRGSMISI